MRGELVEDAVVLNVDPELRDAGGDARMVGWMYGLNDAEGAM
jgi:hypothetical protein